MVAMVYPYEAAEERKKRGEILWGLTAFYLTAMLFKIRIDYASDQAKWFFYVARSPSGGRVFYAKSIQHMCGLVVMMSVVINSIISCDLFGFTDSRILYHTSLNSALMSLLYAVIMGLGTDMVPILVQRHNDTGRRIGYELSACDQTPPIWRCRFFVIDNTKGAFALE